MRVSLDTNVLVSAFATRGLSADILNLVLVEQQLVLGETVLGELGRILRDKFDVSAGTIEETLTFLRTQSVIVGGAPPLSVSIRDDDDRRVLAEAVEGLAEVLVAGDRDLLEIASQAPIRVLTPRGL